MDTLIIKKFNKPYNYNNIKYIKPNINNNIIIIKPSKKIIIKTHKLTIYKCTKKKIQFILQDNDIYFFTFIKDLLNFNIKYIYNILNKKISKNKLNNKLIKLWKIKNDSDVILQFNLNDNNIYNYKKNDKIKAELLFENIKITSNNILTNIYINKLINTKQNNTKQNNTEENNTKQNNTKQNNTEENNTKQNNTKQNNTEENNIEENNIEENNIEENNIEENNIEENNIEENSIEQNSIEENNIEENSIEQNSIEENNIEENNIEENSIEQNSIEQNSIEENSIEENSIEQNSIEENNIELESIEENNIEQNNIEENSIELDNIRDINLEQDNIDNKLIVKNNTYNEYYEEDDNIINNVIMNNRGIKIRCKNKVIIKKRKSNNLKRYRINKFKNIRLYILDDFIDNNICYKLINYIKEFNSIKLNYDNNIIKYIKHKLLNLMNISSKYLEELKILYYNVHNSGDECKDRYDWLNTNNYTDRGNRLWTIYLYLNNVKEGGELNFIKNNYIIKPKPGRLVIWKNINNNNKNYNTLHNEKKIITGEKIIIKFGIMEKKI